MVTEFSTFEAILKSLLIMSLANFGMSLDWLNSQVTSKYQTVLLLMFFISLCQKITAINFENCKAVFNSFALA